MESPFIGCFSLSLRSNNPDKVTDGLSIASLMSPDRSKGFWAMMEHSMCEESPFHGKWMALFRAVERRDHESVISPSKALLEGALDLSNQRVAYLASLAIAPSIAIGNGQSALEFFNKWEKVGLRGTGNKLVIKSLLAQAMVIE